MIPFLTFKNVDSVVLLRKLESQCRVMGLEDAQVVVQDGQLVSGIAQEATEHERDEH